jgi:hypothetical protein
MIQLESSVQRRPRGPGRDRAPPSHEWGSRAHLALLRLADAHAFRQRRPGSSAPLTVPDCAASRRARDSEFATASIGKSGHWQPRPGLVACTSQRASPPARHVRRWRAAVGLAPAGPALEAPLHWAVIVYLDDSLCFSSSLPQHMRDAAGPLLPVAGDALREGLQSLVRPQ